MNRFVISFCALLFFSLSYATAQPAAEVEQVVTAFLEAISNQDTTAFRATMVDEASLIALFNRDNQPGYHWRNLDSDVKMLGQTKSKFLERMWDPEIKIDGQLASVWTRYDFYQDGKFSHCGTDAFHVIQTVAGWKISSVVYTIESDPDKCPESPLGEPEF